MSGEGRGTALFISEEAGGWGGHPHAPHPDTHTQPQRVTGPNAALARPQKCPSMRRGVEVRARTWTNSGHMFNQNLHAERGCACTRLFCFFPPLFAGEV